jgi:predicted phage tail protein
VGQEFLQGEGNIMASLRLYIIPDPLSREGRTSEEYPINPKDLTVANYLPLEFLEGYTITLGSRGELGADELQTATIDPEGDSLTVTPAVGLDPGTWAAIGGWIAAHWVAVAMVILTFATSLYSMLAARKMATGAGDQDLDSSPTYGWNGVETTAAVDVPVAVILGENIVGGNIINAFVENDGEDSYLKAIIAIGEGPLNSICGITEDTDDADLDAIGDKLKLDSNPADNLNGLRVYVRMGTNDQEPIPGFGKLHRMTNLNQELDYEDTDGYRFDTDPARPCDAVRLNLRIDSLFRNHKAEMEETELRVEVAYKKQGADGGFTQAGQFLKNAKYLSPRYFTHELKFPERGAYTVRLIKKNGNSDEEYTRNITLTAVDEVVSEELAYPNTALLAIKIKATSQLSGSLSDVTMWVEGLKNVKQWDGSSWVRKYTRNAIWNMMHAIENEDYGIGKFIPESGRDWEAAKLEAAYCAEKMLLPGETEPQERYFLDMVVDSKMSAFDCLSKMGAAFNCIPYWGASAVLPIIEKPSLPVFPFGESNIVGGTFKLGYSSLSKRKNRVEIQFRNAEHEFKRDLVLREDEESLAAGEPERTNTIFIPGIVRPRQAVMVASQYMKTEKYITRSIGFEAGFGAALCQPGDVVEVAHRVPRWALTSGRITEAGTSGPPDRFAPFST